MSPDTRIYATVLHSDHSLQYSLTVAVSILAAPLNFLSFYLILFKSKRERTSFKVCLFLSQFLFFLSQLHLGVLTGLVTLHPFPGIYSVGPLKDYLSSFTLCFIWCILFATYVYFIFILLIIKLRIVARPGGAFDCSNSTYSVVYILAAVYVFVPVPGILIKLYSTREEMEQFVQLMYPNNLMVFDNPGVFIFTSHNYRTLIESLLLCIILSAVLFNAIMYIFISREIRLGIISKSSKHLEESRRILNNLIIQSMSYAIFLSISCALVLKAFFNDPAEDSRIPNAIAFTSLCGASIPYQMMMIYRNTAYRTCVLEKLNFSFEIPITIRQSIFHNVPPR